MATYQGQVTKDKEQRTKNKEQRTNDKGQISMFVAVDQIEKVFELTGGGKYIALKGIRPRQNGGFPKLFAITLADGKRKYCPCRGLGNEGFTRKRSQRYYRKTY